MSDSPLAVLGDLTKPATVLIEKISDAVGGVFKPYQIVRIAKAEAAADHLRAEAQIEISDLQRRALHRFLEEEAKKQSNIEHITAGALPLLDAAASPQAIESDWITNFFDKCRIVSDSEMQQLWSRILAGQANEPGAFSRRTVNLLGDLEKADAELFTRLCGYTVQLGTTRFPLVSGVDDSIYTQSGISFASLSHLESLGLIQFNNIAGFQALHLPKKFHVEYFGRALQLTAPNDSDNALPLGKALFTRAGAELAPFSGAAPVAGFYEYLYEQWKRQSLL